MFVMCGSLSCLVVCRNCVIFYGVLFDMLIVCILLVFMNFVSMLSVFLIGIVYVLLIYGYVGWLNVVVL